MDDSAFIGAARARAAELNVVDRVTFIHRDAAGYVAGQPAGVASCVGATWIGGGVAGTVDLLRQSLSPGGIMLTGEPYWRRDPPDQATVAGCDGMSREEWLPLPELIESFGLLGRDVVQMVLADQDSWDPGLFLLVGRVPALIKESSNQGTADVGRPVSAAVRAWRVQA
ncbi:MAG TPA: hypothetical protein VF838_18580 [Trebonia sp.]